MAEAARECDGQWGDRWDRSPMREELSHALAVVLRAQPDVYVSDPGRAAAIALPVRPRAPAPAVVKGRTLQWREHPSVLQVTVDDPENSWVVLLSREDGAVMADVLGAPDGAGDVVLREILPAWRARKPWGMQRTEAARISAPATMATTPAPRSGSSRAPI